VIDVSEPSPASVVLYHVPPSFYSQIARLALAEKGVAHVSKFAVAGPPSYETYQPWYMRLNPGGTVPTLVVDGNVLDDSRTILEQLERRFEGPALLPASADARADAERWIEHGYALSERVLAYGSDRLRRLGARVNRGRLEALRRHRERSPDLSAVYDAKIADIEQFIAETNDAELVARMRQQLGAMLDELDAWLKNRRFIAGEAYSLADVVWTVTVARQSMLRHDPLRDRPALASWYARMKARPSFVGASVWERAHPAQVLRVLFTKFTAAFIGISLVLTGLAVAAICVVAISCAG
jgi:glutathione S-transferase